MTNKVMSKRKLREKVLHKLAFPSNASKPKMAVTHPGKMGDAIYALPTIRWLCNLHDTQADFWTSNYCAPLKELFEYQSCISKFCVNDSYKIQHMGCGAQPWLVPVPDDYFSVFHLGFRSFPGVGGQLSNYMASLVGAPHGLQIRYDYDESVQTIDGTYVVVAPRGEMRFVPFIEELSRCMAVVQIGTASDKVTNHGFDKTGLNFLDTLPWIAKSSAYVGCWSSQLVLAEGFNIPRWTNIPNVDELVRILS